MIFFYKFCKPFFEFEFFILKLSNHHWITINPKQATASWTITKSITGSFPTMNLFPKF